MNWWKNLKYWKKGALIGVIFGVIFFFIISKFELVHSFYEAYGIVVFLAGVGFLLSVFKMILGNNIFTEYLTLALMYALPPMILGGIIGHIIDRAKKK